MESSRWLRAYAVFAWAGGGSSGLDTATATESGPLDSMDVDAGDDPTQPYMNLDGVDDVLAETLGRALHPRFHDAGGAIGCDLPGGRRTPPPPP